MKYQELTTCVITRKKLFITLSEKLGKVSAIADQPEKPTAVLVLAHGAGAGMTHPFMESLTELILQYHIAVLRYQFRYMELGTKRPDPPAIAHKVVAAALEKAHELFPKLPVLAGGKSFGGRMSSQYLASTSPDFVKGIVFFGFPLHAPGNPSTDRADHLQDVSVPMLFLQGTRDALADKVLIKKVSSKLENSTLQFFEGADHSFRSGKKVFIEELAASFVKWVSEN